MEKVKSTCRSCGSACSVIVCLEEGVVKKVLPDPEGPVNKGIICPKGAASLELLNSPHRLEYPMIRVGKRGEGKWKRVSWDEALNHICEKIGHIKEAHGAESISLVQGTGRHHLKHTLRFANALGTPNWYEPGAAQCYFPRVCAGGITYGAEAGPAYLDGIMPECVLVWGSNPSNSSAGIRSRLDVDSVRGDVKLIVVDPRPTKLAKKADIWLRIRPGTDAALALCFMNIIISEGLYDKDFVEKWCYGFEELARRCEAYTPDVVSRITWLSEEDILTAARLFARSKPATLEWGCSLEHTPNTFHTVRALCMLPVITGNYDVPGGWVENLDLMPTPDILLRVLPEAQAKKRLGAEQFPLLSSNDYNSCPTTHIPTLYHAALTGEPYPIKALMLFGNNSLMEVADSHKVRQVFEAMDFVSCMDLFMTPTAEMADIVLPAASWLEYDHVCGGAGLGGTAILTVKKLARRGEARSDEEVFCELARRLGLPYEADSVYDIMNAQLAHLEKRFPEYKGLDFQRMKELTYLTVPMEYKKYEKRGGFKTRTGKIELYSTVMKELGLDPLPAFAEPPESPYSKPETAKEFPLVLITGSRQRQYFVSEGRYLPMLRKLAAFPRVEIHPDTAKKLGIEDGDWVFIENERGRCTQKALYTEGIDPRVVHAQIGWYYPEKGGPDYGWTESNINLLTNQEPPYDPASGTYQLNALLCKVYKNPDDSIENRWKRSYFH